MWHGTVADVGDGKQTHTLIAGENRLFEMIARDEPLATVLDSLCRLVEDVSSGSLAAILLLDPESNTLSHAAAPSLPRAYTSALDHITPGPNVGACGTAAYRNEAVISADIATDPLWDDFRDIPLSNGLRACWSTPIRSCSGAVLGTFAILFRHPHTPTPQHFDLIEQITHVASLAIDRSRTLATLRQHEQEFRQIVDFVPQHIIVLAPDGSRLYAYQRALEEGRESVVGVNVHATSDEPPTEILDIDPELERRQVERLRAVRERRDQPAADRALAGLAAAAGERRNLMPPILDCVRAEATLGEIAHALRRVYGEHRDIETG
jgi:PAS domain-containing protein